MDRWTKFGVVMGAVLGFLFRIFVWMAFAWGVITSIINHEVPYLPVILLFTYYTFIGTIRINNYIRMGILSMQQVKANEESDVQRMAKLINMMNLYRGGNQQ